MNINRELTFEVSLIQDGRHSLPALPNFKFSVIYSVLQMCI